MNSKTKRFLDNLKFVQTEIENLQSDKGFQEYHADEKYDDIYKKIYDVQSHVEDLIEELTEGVE